MALGFWTVLRPGLCLAAPQMSIVAKGERAEVQHCLEIQKALDLGERVSQGSAAGLSNCWGLLLAVLGPEVAARVRTTCQEARASYNDSVLKAAACNGSWATKDLLATAPPLVTLMAAAERPAAILRSAALGPALLGAASTWAPDAQGRPPLVLAAMRGLEMVKALLCAKAHANVTDKAGWTPLMWASQAGDIACCIALVRTGASLNAISKDGASALLCGARADKHTGAIHVVKELLLALADPELVPRHMHEHLEPEVQQFLQEALRAHIAAGRSRRLLAVSSSEQ